MPCNTPTTEPMGLNACEKFNLCSELFEAQAKRLKDWRLFREMPILMQSQKERAEKIQYPF